MRCIVICMTRDLMWYIDNYFKEQQIVKNNLNKELAPAKKSDKIPSFTKNFFDTESSLIMKHRNQIHGKQNRNLTSLNSTVWPSSTIFSNSANYSQYQFGNDNRVRVIIHPRFEMNNMQEDRLKLRKSENRVDVRRPYGEKFNTTFNSENLKKLSSKRMAALPQPNPTRKLTSSNIIYLHENETSKCVMN